MPTELPTLSARLPLAGDACERADAARNRTRILAAAERLIEERGIEAVSMEAIAMAAGVGKGTLFRRFGDRAGLVYALLDSRERALQERMIRGEPPLGPGAPPVDRIVAFGHRLLQHLDAVGDLLLDAADTASATRPSMLRFAGGVAVPDIAEDAYSLRLVSSRKLYDLGTLVQHSPHLAPLAADIHLYMRRVRGLSLERLAAGYEQLVRAVLGGGEHRAPELVVEQGALGREAAAEPA